MWVKKSQLHQIWIEILAGTNFDKPKIWTKTRNKEKIVSPTNLDENIASPAHVDEKMTRTSNLAEKHKSMLYLDENFDKSKFWMKMC